MKNLKTWHVLGGIGLLALSVSNIIQYGNNLNDSSLGVGPLVLLNVLLLLISPLFLIASAISFVWYLTKAFQRKETGVMRQVLLMCILTLITFALIQITKNAPTYHL